MDSKSCLQSNFCIIPDDGQRSQLRQRTWGAPAIQQQAQMKTTRDKVEWMKEGEERAVNLIGERQDKAPMPSPRAGARLVLVDLCTVATTFHVSKY